VRGTRNIISEITIMFDQVNMNEDLTKMMEKSATNQLKDDGLTTLTYNKVAEKEFPLYTW